MNQVSCLKAANAAENDFYKFMNNSNFAYHCRNNIDDFSFAPIADQLDKISQLIAETISENV